MSSQNETLLGGREVAITFDTGEVRTVFVRQLRVGEYHRAFPKLDNEIALVAFASGLTDAEAGTVNPESYELLHAAVREVNAKGFFVWSARQLERAQKQLADMPPEMVRLVVERTTPGLTPPSPGLPPRRP